MIWLFWISLFTIGFVYFGYPFLVWTVGRLSKTVLYKRPVRPTVSILISAYNEEKCIADTIENKLALHYPKEKIEIIVVSDASTDRTNAIVQRYRDRGVKLIAQTRRAGKTAALNRAVEEAKGAILVFSDANSLYHSEALAHLVENFGDPSVGYVTGRMTYMDKSGTVVGQGCNSYMSYENRLRQWETAIGSVVGIDGGIDAMRKSLYVAMRHDLLPDFVLPLHVAKKGFRVVYEPAAILAEPALEKSSDEWKMRIRVSLRAFHALWYMRSLFNFFRHGFFSVQLFVHKLLRYMIGFFQIALLVSSYWLAPQSIFYTVALASQAAFYLMSFGGFFLKNTSRKGYLLGYAYYFCLLNAAAAWAFVKFLRGHNSVVWQPRKGY